MVICRGEDLLLTVLQLEGMFPSTHNTKLCCVSNQWSEGLDSQVIDQSAHCHRNNNYAYRLIHIGTTGKLTVNMPVLNFDKPKLPGNIIILRLSFRRVWLLSVCTYIP